MDKKAMITEAVVFVAGLSAGYAVGYFIAKRKANGYVEKEIQSVKDSYALSRKEGVFSTPEGAVEALISDEDIHEMASDAADSIIEDEGYGVQDDIFEEEVDETLDTRSEGEGDTVIRTENVWEKHGNDIADEDAQAAVDALNQAIRDEPGVEEALPGEEFADADGNTPEDERIFPRDADHPYIISEWQFMHDGEHEDEKMSLLYFEGDETLVDERETLIPNVEEIVGHANLHRFGTGTRDNNTLYIRNEKIGADYEIIRDVRNFTEVVLGIKPAKSSPLRMRDDDQ